MSFKSAFRTSIKYFNALSGSVSINIKSHTIRTTVLNKSMSASDAMAMKSSAMSRVSLITCENKSFLDGMMYISEYIGSHNTACQTRTRVKVAKSGLPRSFGSATYTEALTTS